MNTENLLKLRNLLPPSCTNTCRCYLCRTSDRGTAPEETENMALTCGELVDMLTKMPASAPLAVEMFSDGDPHVALVRSVYRHDDAPAVVVMAVEPNQQGKYWV